MPKPHRDNGFALIIVIWGLGLIALLFLATIAAARWRVAPASNTAAAAQAASLAEAATTLTLSRLASASGALDRASSFDGRPVTCNLPQRAVAAIAIEDEGGKVDLNDAPPKLIEALLTGFGVEPNGASSIARAIVDFRSANTREGETDTGVLAPKHGLFQTIFELDQVAGIEPALVRALLPFITVSSARAGVDPAVAPPALFAALSGAPLGDVRALVSAPYPNQLNRTNPRFPLPFIQSSPGGVFLVHVEVVLPSGATAVRETLADLRMPAGAEFKVKELRQGTPRYLASLKAVLASGGGLPDC